MRTLTTLGVAAVLALGPTASASALSGPELTEVSLVAVSGAELTEVAPVSKTSLARTGGATTNGFLTDINCFFFKRCG